MADRCAYGFAAAWQVARPADRSTLFADASMRVQAVVIGFALDLDAGNIRVALVALLAGANRFMIHDAAEGVLAAGAGVFADAIDTGIGIPTLVVCTTAGQDGSQGFAARFLITDIAVGAGTYHCSHRQRVYDGAGGRVAAGSQRFAEWLTLGTQAGMLGWTVLVLDTLRHSQWYAQHIGIAGEADGAAALGLVIRHQAVCIAGTGVLIKAGVDAVSVATGLVCRTLRVGAAANHLAAS